MVVVIVLLRRFVPGFRDGLAELGHTLRTSFISLVTFVRDGGVEAGLLFLVVVALSSIVASPIWLPGVVGGYVYGYAGGVAFGAVGLASHLAIGFFLGRTVLRRFIHRRAASWALWPRIELALKHEGARLVFLLRMTPLVPQNLLSFALGATSLSFSRFMFGTLGSVPILLFHVYLGRSASRIEELMEGGSGDWRSFAATIVISVVALFFVVRTASRVLARTLDANPPPTPGVDEEEG